MININDYKYLKEGDYFIFKSDYDPNLNDIFIITKIRKDIYMDKNPNRYKVVYYNNNYCIEARSFYLGSKYSESVFMYFRDKNINKLLSNDD